MTEHLTGKTVARFVIDKFNGHQHTFATRIVYQIGIFTRKLSKTIQERIAFLFRLGREILFQQDVNGRQRGSTSQWITAKSGGMQEGVVEQNRKHLFSRDGGANRHHAAAQGFRQTQNIRLHIFVLTGKHLAGTPHAGLYFIQNHQRAEVVTELTYLCQVSLRRQDHAAFTLNRLQNHGCYLVARFFAFAKCHAHRVDIAKRHMAEARQ